MNYAQAYAETYAETFTKHNHAEAHAAALAAAVNAATLPFAVAGASLMEFPPTGLVETNLFAACKRPGEGTGWSYYATHVLVSDLYRAAKHRAGSEPVPQPKQGVADDETTALGLAIKRALNAAYAIGTAPSETQQFELWNSIVAIRTIVNNSPKDNAK